MTIKHLFPVSKPTLDLNFAAERSLDPSITFTRASTGTYVDENGIVRTAVDNEPRFDHDFETGESLGLLIEESRTNSQEWSSDFSQTSSYSLLSNGDGVAPVLDGTLYEAPDGSTTAQRWTLQITDTTNAGNQSGIQASASGIPAGAYVTVWAKSATGADQTVFLTSQDNDTFTVTSKWQRFDLGPRGTIPFRAMARGTYTNAVVDILLWGIQMEAGAFGTSYIPTAGATAPRAADVCTIEGDNFSSWYNTSESTWYAEGDQLKTDANGDQDEQSSMFVDRYSNTSLERWQRTVWRVKQARNALATNTNTPATPKGSKAKTAFALDTVNVRFAVGGSLSPVGVLGAYPGTTEFRLAKDTSLGVDLNGHIARLAYYPRRLSDEQLEALTS